VVPKVNLKERYDRLNYRLMSICVPVPESGFVYLFLISCKDAEEVKSFLEDAEAAGGGPSLAVPCMMAAVALYGIVNSQSLQDDELPPCREMAEVTVDFAKKWVSQMDRESLKKCLMDLGRIMATYWWDLFVNSQARINEVVDVVEKVFSDRMKEFLPEELAEFICVLSNDMFKESSLRSFDRETKFLREEVIPDWFGSTDNFFEGYKKMVEKHLYDWDYPSHLADFLLALGVPYEKIVPLFVFSSLTSKTSLKTVHEIFPLYEVLGYTAEDMASFINQGIADLVEFVEGTDGRVFFGYGFKKADVVRISLALEVMGSFAGVEFYGNLVRLTKALIKKLKSGKLMTTLIVIAMEPPEDGQSLPLSDGVKALFSSLTLPVLKAAPEMLAPVIEYKKLWSDMFPEKYKRLLEEFYP